MILKNKVLKLLRDGGLDYAVVGKNISNKVIAGIQCPFCGNDEGYHLGLFESGIYYCWKDSTHKGNLAYLLSRLLNLSLSEVKREIEDNNVVSDENLLDKIDKIWYTMPMKDERLGGVKNLLFHPDFRRLTQAGARPFIYYLSKRGYKDYVALAERYQLYFCPSWSSSNSWRNRLIFPFFMNNKLLTWVGRDVTGISKLRYKNLSIEESVVAPKFALWNYNTLKYGGKTLYIVEGLFDAMKIDFYTDKDVTATPILTTSIHEEQVKLLSKIEDRFSEVVITLDHNAEKQALKLADELSFFKKVSVKFLPDKIKDPGDMTEEEIKNFVYNR